jgi:hypothetical protein
MQRPFRAERDVGLFQADVRPFPVQACYPRGFGRRLTIDKPRDDQVAGHYPFNKQDLWF